MPITIKIDGPNGRFTYETTSEERIYRCDEIMRLAAPFGFKRVTGFSDSESKTSLWILLQKQYLEGEG